MWSGLPKRAFFCTGSKLRTTSRPGRGASTCTPSSFAAIHLRHVAISSGWTVTAWASGRFAIAISTPSMGGSSFIGLPIPLWWTCGTCPRTFSRTRAYTCMAGR